MEVDLEKREKRGTSVLGTRTTPEFLKFIDEAIEASEGKYTTRAEFTRDAIEGFARYIKEGGLKRGYEEREDPSELDKEHESDVEEALELIKETEDTDLESLREFAEKAKMRALQKSVWSDQRVQKATRRLLKDEVYPRDFWSDEPRFRRRKAREYTEALRHILEIPRSIAKELIEDPIFKGREYQEWW